MLDDVLNNAQEGHIEKNPLSRSEDYTNDIGRS